MSKWSMDSKNRCNDVLLPGMIMMKIMRKKVGMTRQSRKETSKGTDRETEEVRSLSNTGGKEDQVSQTMIREGVEQE